MIAIIGPTLRLTAAWSKKLEDFSISLLESIMEIRNVALTFETVYEIRGVTI